MMFAVPFLWPLHTTPYTSFYNEWLAAVLLIAACFGMCLHRDSSEQAEVTIPAVAPLFLPLAAVVAIQWGAGRFAYSSDAELPLMSLLLATAALLLGAALRHMVGLRSLLLWFCLAAVAGGLLSVGIQFLQLAAMQGISFSLLNFDTGGQYFGALAQRNHLSTYLNWGIVASLYLYASGRIRLVALFVLVLLFCLGVSLTASRTGLLQIVWIAVAGAIFMRLTVRTDRPRGWQWVLVLPLLFVIVNLALPLLLNETALSTSGVTVYRAGTEGLDSSRRLLYANGISLFSSNPLLGIGPGQLFHNQFALLDQIEKTLYASSTHNLVLDLFVFTGVVGALPFLWLLGAWATRVLRQAMSVERAAGLLLLSVLAVHAMLELPHWYAYFLLPAALLVGALDPGWMRMPRRRWMAILPLALCIYGAVLAATMWGQYRDLERLFATYQTTGGNRANVNEQRLVELLAFQQRTWFSGPAEYLVFNSIALNENALQDKLAIGARTMRYLPEPHVVYRYVLLLALAGRQQEGVALLHRTRKMFPEAYHDILAEFRELARYQPEIFGSLVSAFPAERTTKPDVTKG